MMFSLSPAMVFAVENETGEPSIGDETPDETESVEYAFIDLSEEVVQQIEVCAVPFNKEYKCVQEETTRKALVA